MLRVGDHDRGPELGGEPGAIETPGRNGEHADAVRRQRADHRAPHDRVAIDVDLGLMLRPMKSTILAKIEQRLNEKFA